MPDLNKIQENVVSLQKDMAKVDALVERLDVTIEKLTEVSANVSQLLAVQENRLVTQEKMADKLQEHLENNKKETEISFKEVYSKISMIEKELTEDMEETKDKVIQRIDELSKEGTGQHNALNDRISKIERYMWLLIGGATIIGFLLNNSEILAKIFS